MSRDLRQDITASTRDSGQGTDFISWCERLAVRSSMSSGAKKAFAQRSRKAQCDRREYLHVRFRKSSHPQYVDLDAWFRPPTSPTACSAQAVPSKSNFHTTNACRLETDELQMQLVTVGRSSIFGVSRTEIEYARRHVPRFWARESGSVRSASQPRCAIIQSFAGPLNPRPL